MSHYRLTPEYEEQVVQYIRAGGFDWVASEAAGVPRTVLEHWLALGTAGRRRPYRRFLERVMQARAQARLKAEIEVRDQDPRFWLRHGPGRERNGLPGWTNPVRPSAPIDTAAHPFDAAEFAKLLGMLLRALMPFPAAHAAVLQALGRAR